MKEFKKYFEMKLNEEKINVTIENIKGDKIRIIEVGHSFNIVIHPKDWIEIKQLIKGKEDRVGFRDEQGKFWYVYLNGKTLRFECNYEGKIVEVELNKLK